LIVPKRFFCSKFPWAGFGLNHVAVIAISIFAKLLYFKAVMTVLIENNDGPLKSQPMKS